MRNSRTYLNCLEQDIKFFKKKNSNESVAFVYTNSRILKFVFSNSGCAVWNEGSKHIDVLHTTTSIKLPNILKILNNLAFSLSRFWFTKISFKGKGFKIKRRKRTKSIKFFFYHSHVNTILVKRAKLKQKKKNKIILKFWQEQNFKHTEQKIVNIRGLNIFTKRGLRASRQLVFKKAGKKSNY